MEMEKYKICPICGRKNPPTLFECEYDETDLTAVRITEDSVLPESDLSKQEPDNTSSLVRVCECGELNPPNLRKCNSCGEDISDITPTPYTSVECNSKKNYLLSSIDGSFSYRITSSEIIIGAENEMSQYLKGKTYVSRTHAKMYLEEDDLYVENLSKTNPTFVNNIEITEKTKLKDNDEIGLGGKIINGERQVKAAYFKVGLN